MFTVRFEIFWLLLLVHLHEQPQGGRALDAHLTRRNFVRPGESVFRFVFAVGSKKLRTHICNIAFLTYPTPRL